MASDVWFRFFPSDWISGVAQLSAAERGVYVTLLALMYDHGGPIRRDDNRLSRMCGLPKAAATRAIEALLALEKLAEEDGFLFNDRAKSELTERENRKRIAQENANARWEKAQENQLPNYAPALLTHCADDAHARGESQNQKSLLETTSLVIGEPITPSENVVSIERKPNPEKRESVMAFGEWWNALASSAGLRLIDKIDGFRGANTWARVRDLKGDHASLDAGLRFLEAKIRGSPFLLGRTERPWRGFTFDWLVKASNFQKVVEGNYDEARQTRRF